MAQKKTNKTLIASNKKGLGDKVPEFDNGKLNAKAGIGVYFQDDDSRNVSKKITGKQTNNRAELLAIIVAYFIIEKDVEGGKTIVICTDSEYAIRCFTSYGEKCDRQGWKKEIPNIMNIKLALLTVEKYQ